MQQFCMPDRYLPVLFWILALAACGRSADPALQIYANSKCAVIVTGMLGDDRSLHHHGPRARARRNGGRPVAAVHQALHLQAIA